MEENNLLNESDINKDDNIFENFNQGIEILSKRGKREKHFLQENGDIIATMYSDDVHFEKDGNYEEIDNSLVKVENYYRNKNNSFKVYFNETNNVNLMGYELLNGNLNISVLNSNNVPIQVVESETKFNQVVKYENIFDGIDFEYNVTPTKVKENIIIKNRDSLLNELNFVYNTNLKLELKENGSINAIKDNETLFVLDAPYIKDANGSCCTNTYYQLERIDTGYRIKLQLDYNWLNSDDVKYPVIIDPTISTDKEGNVYDTYIYPNDTNDKRSNQTILKVGVEKENNKEKINRALVKFDLPTIGTGCQIYSAILNLFCYPIHTNDNTSYYVNVHRITNDWTEENANWENSNNKYDNKIEATCLCGRSKMNTSGVITETKTGMWDITNLVKKWYADTSNYGVMLKLNEEIYKYPAIPMFFSKDNGMDINNNPKPTLIIRYNNQNGIEEYMNYITQQFADGVIYENTYNGNLTTIFQIGKTMGSQISASLDIVYNTNDVVLNVDRGYGIGYKLNLQQTIKKVTIDNVDYLEYLDIDGTIHYFSKKDELYEDENYMGMTIQDNEDNYLLKTKNGDSMKFTKLENIGYLSECIDDANNKIQIFYNSDNLINKIIDTNNQEISLLYEESKITVTSPDRIVYLNYLDNKLDNISTFDGNINFYYNDKNLISRVVGKDGMSSEYQYYNQNPYKIKRVIEYGINNGIGTSFAMIYGNKTTTILDNDGKVSTVNFNENGNALSICNLKGENNIDGAYATMSSYGNTGAYKNRLLSYKIPEKHVKNYLLNTGFEKENINFTVSSDSVVMGISESDSYSGKKCLKTTTTTNNNEYIYREVVVPKGNDYTFSAYLKNTTKAKIVLGYEKVDGTVVEVGTNEINSSSEYDRYDVTINYPTSAFSSLYIKIFLLSPGILYLDNIQLEKGHVANLYNYFENSDFSQGINDWEITGDINNFEVVNLEVSNIPALKIKMKPDQVTSLKKVLNIYGHKGDEINISFWYKNEGISRDKNSVMLKYNYLNDLIAEDEKKYLNPSDNTWQYFSTTLVAKEDYTNVELMLSQENEANTLYITNISAFKGISQSKYDYDNKGNLINVQNINKDTNSFSYDENNQMIKTTDSNGKKLFLEYDNIVKSRLKNSISESGICNKTMYNTMGNVILNRTCNNYSVGNIEGGLYTIRAKGTDNYIRYIMNVPTLTDKCSCHDKWLIEVNEEYVSIKHSIVPNKYFSVQNDNLILSDFQNDKSLFKLIKNDNGSYSIKLKSDERYLKTNGQNIEITSQNDETFELQFYFETVNNEYFMESSAMYTDDERFVKSVEDSNLNKVLYDVDSTTGLINSVTDPKGIVTEYKYNTDRQLSSIKKGDKTINYVYNSNHMLEKIVQGSRNYKFLYDEFLNKKSTIIGDTIVICTNNYADNNGKLLSKTYGNNHMLKYDYDEFDRLAKLTKMDDTYQYIYGCNENLLKVISNEHLHKFEYDLEQRLLKYSDNDFSIKYTYGDGELITNQKYQLLDNIQNVTTEYNGDKEILKTIFDDNELVYTYDNLGRIMNNSINDKINVKTNYITNGKRTTTLIKDIIINDDKFTYVYNKLNDIICIKHNNNIENQYYYDIYGQLIKENNYITNKTTTYTYDSLGNILTQKTYNMSDNSLVSQNLYEYNNLEWQDQLTKFNSDVITYDEIGNPLKIGDNITLSWINGKELNSYKDTSNVINYKYNNAGIRTRKIVNDVETEYYLDGYNIVYEKSDNNILYFIRDNIEGLIGFKYNNDIYYYIKNNQDDIIKLLDSNYNTVAIYQYDSWGNIISITDGKGNDVSANKNHIANINPFRYRSYYYDRETKLYYLNSRYYNPKWGRFLSADSIGVVNESLTGYNFYTYAENNPINKIDTNGNFSLKKIIKKAVKKVKKAVKKVVKTVKKVVKTVKKAIKTVKKAYNYVNTAVSNFNFGIPKVKAANNKPAPKKTGVFEWGVGLGAGVDVGISGKKLGKVGGYHDATWTKQGSNIAYESVTGNFGIGAFGFSLLDSYSHLDHGAHGGAQDIETISNCENTKHSLTFSTPISSRNIAGEDTDTRFVGIDISIHFIVGGHIRLGWEFEE